MPLFCFWLTLSPMCWLRKNKIENTLAKVNFSLYRNQRHFSISETIQTLQSSTVNLAIYIYPPPPAKTEVKNPVPLSLKTSLGSQARTAWKPEPRCQTAAPLLHSAPFWTRAPSIPAPTTSSTSYPSPTSSLKSTNIIIIIISISLSWVLYVILGERPPSKDFFKPGRCSLVSFLKKKNWS